MARKTKVADGKSCFAVISPNFVRRENSPPPPPGVELRLRYDRVSVREISVDGCVTDGERVYIPLLEPVARLNNALTSLRSRCRSRAARLSPPLFPNFFFPLPSPVKRSRLVGPDKLCGGWSGVSVSKLSGGTPNFRKPNFPISFSSSSSPFCSEDERR